MLELFIILLSSAVIVLNIVFGVLIYSRASWTRLHEFLLVSDALGTLIVCLIVIFIVMATKISIPAIGAGVILFLAIKAALWSTRIYMITTPPKEK